MKHVNLFSTMDLYNSAKLQYPNISYVEETEKVILVNKLFPKNNQIFYTTTDGQIVEPMHISDIISNVYEDGQGVITSRKDITTLISTFYNKPTVTSVQLPNSVTLIRENCFNGTSIEKIEIPASVVEFGQTSLKGATNLEKIVFADNSNLQKIGSSSFEGTKITDITIPSSVTYIGQFLFGDNNNYLSSVTFEESDLELTIDSWAFKACLKLVSFNWPRRAKIIKGRTFEGCSSLTSIEIPSSVTEIGLYAFASCTSLTNIIYDGTSTQFASITKGSSWKNGVPTTCIVHCTDGDFPITQFA